MNILLILDLVFIILALKCTTEVIRFSYIVIGKRYEWCTGVKSPDNTCSNQVAANKTLKSRPSIHAIVFHVVVSRDVHFRISAYSRIIRNLFLKFHHHSMRSNPSAK